MFLKDLRHVNFLRLSLTTLILTPPYSYLLLIFNFNIGRIEEAVFTIATLSFLTGFLIWDMETIVIGITSIIISELLSLVIALYVIINPVLTYGLDICIVVFLSFIQRILPLFLLIILPLSLFFKILGIILLERIT